MLKIEEKQKTLKKINIIRNKIITDKVKYENTFYVSGLGGFSEWSSNNLLIKVFKEYSKYDNPQEYV